MDFKEICDKTIEVARRAGDFIRNERKNFTVDKIEIKGYQDMVSYVDKQAEVMIVEGLRPIVEGAGFLTEEGTVTFENGGDYCWIVDPLDGTTNFIHGLPPYCVSIALCKGEEVVVGVVYEVTLSECFYSYKGAPSYLNSEIITVSKTSQMKNALIATGMAYNSLDRIDEFHRQMDYFMKYTHGARRIGSAAADLVYVAAGRFDAFSQFNLSPWDVAAGIIIARNAGAIVTDYKGGGNMLYGKEIVATTPGLYQAYMKVINQC